MHTCEASGEALRGEGPEAAARARELTRGFLREAVPDGRAAGQDVLLVVSELVTNAVRHAGGLAGFRLRSGPGTVEVSVRDHSRATPLTGDPDPTCPGGFGWPLVRRLAESVDIRLHTSGKTITAVLAL
ncbi:ATP-binding protein [Streptomyces sp. NPDC102406]|uniref:ATP-binding protein n=1 Tax=Streptomyces sp. NPDC102406 TaxID=3366171 RepID=UPI003822047E